MKYAFGIDPGLKTGVALYNRTSKKFDLITTTNFWDAYKTVSLVHSNCVTAGDELFFFVEDPNMVSHNWHLRPGQSARVSSKIGENVGKNKSHAALWIDLVKNSLHCECRTTAHSAGKRIPVEQFRRLTGWAGELDEHSKDAAALVWGI